jgi:uncharacterized membrane protein
MDDGGRQRARSFAPLRWLRTKLRQVSARVRDAARSVATAVRAKIGSPVRLVKTAFKAIAGEDRGFTFWWLAVTAALAIAVGLLVAALLSPVIGILAALAVGIWMLLRRSRSARSRKTVKAGSPAQAVG